MPPRGARRMTYNPYEIPHEDCPYCGTQCECDLVDIGVGYRQAGPFHCRQCKASEIGPYDERRELSEDEKRTGWYAPHSPAGSSANTDSDGNIITWVEARANYRVEADQERIEQGLMPVYDATGDGYLNRKTFGYKLGQRILDAMKDNG